MRVIMAIHVDTGQRLPPVRRIATDSNFSRFFWNSKVICTVLAVEVRFGSVLLISFVSRKKRMLRTHNSLVFLVLLLGSCPTCEYSHDLIAKRRAPLASWDIPVTIGEMAITST